MKQKIDYWDWRDDEFVNLSYTDIDELAEDFIEDIEKPVEFPITVEIYGFRLQDKKDYVPSEIEIINDVRDILYENSYLEDYDTSGKDLSEKLLKKAKTFRNELMKELPDFYRGVVSKTIDIYEDGHWEEHKEKDLSKVRGYV